MKELHCGLLSGKVSSITTPSSWFLLALCWMNCVQEIIEKVTSLSRDKSLQNDQCLVMFILSHGAVREVDRRKVECVFGSDGESLTIDRILSPFTNASCPLLRNKPKLVFVQACRGGTVYIKTLNFDSSDSFLSR